VRRPILTILGASAVYGFSIGSVHSARLAAWNLAKFPLLIFLTCSICALAYFAFALLVTRRLTPRDVMDLSLRTFADLSVLLASLAPVSYFLARTIVQPTPTSLNEYPRFLGLNVAFIAACGLVALARQTLRIEREHRLDRGRSAAILSAWLLISLFAGGQCAWYMRPFFGPSTITDPPFMEGTNPDYRGATSFYEAVWHLVAPPPLPEDYTRSGRTR
jgi:hypothetical protein